MIIQYQYLDTEKLLVQKYKGEWSTEDYMLFVDTIQAKSFEGLIKVLTDLREISRFEEAFKNFESLKEIRKRILPVSIVNVHLIDKPGQTAIIHLYQQELSDTYKYSYCSTIKQAIKLLGMNGSITEAEMENILANLKSQF